MKALHLLLVTGGACASTIKYNSRSDIAHRSVRWNFDFFGTNNNDNDATRDDEESPTGTNDRENKPRRPSDTTNNGPPTQPPGQRPAILWRPRPASSPTNDESTPTITSSGGSVPWAPQIGTATEPPSKRPSNAPTKNPSYSPTKEPTNKPSASPTLGPTNTPTPLQYCPPAYNLTKTDYVVGDLVEAESHVFQCANGPTNDTYYMYERYCNIVDDAVLGDNVTEKELWDLAWTPLHACYRTEVPTLSPTTMDPTILSSMKPSIQSSEVPSIAMSESPSNSPSFSPSVHPTQRPTKQPTENPTTSPSKNPTNEPTPLPYCPPAYDPNRTNYVAGEQIELLNHIHECAGGRDENEARIYEPYCNIVDSSQLNGDEAELELWNEAWTPISACYKTDTPTKSPSPEPTYLPSSSPIESPGVWYPDLYVEEQRCVKGEDYPSWMGLQSNANDYLFETRDECCNKHVCDDTLMPTRKPTTQPSKRPSQMPSKAPSRRPTKRPSAPPSISPSLNPTNEPSTSPSTRPTNSPSKAPSDVPTSEPTTSPTITLTLEPSKSPTAEPSRSPSKAPSTPRPTRKPTTPRPVWGKQYDPTPNTPNPTTRRPTEPPTWNPEILNILDKFPYPYPYTRFTAWERLSNSEQNIGTSLGYFRTSWDNLEIYDLETLAYSDLTSQEKQYLMSLGMDGDQWDCYMNHYNGYYWDDLPKTSISQHLATLGYTQTSWDEDEGAETEDMYWDELSEKQKEAAYKLCYFKNSWDWVDLNNW